MKGALVILIFLVVTGVVLYLFELRWRRRHNSTPAMTGRPAASPTDPMSGPSEDVPDGEVCCGMHITCEKDTLSVVSDEVVYYDDEELDRFIGRTPESYTPEEADEFNEVLMTLRPEDVPGWARSITLRGLQLPSDVRDALLIIVNDQRATRNG